LADGRIAHRAVIAVAAFGERRIEALRGVAVVAGHRVSERLRIQAEPLRQFRQRIGLMQIARFTSASLFTGAGRQTEAVALHRRASQIRKQGAFSAWLCMALAKW
jgi:hypothetical protein